MKNNADTLQKFIFEKAPIRGEIVSLEQTWQRVIDLHNYPDVLRNFMGELAAAAVLLAATLKLQGSLILQIHGQGAVKLLVVECTGDLGLRATAKWEGELPSSATFKELVGNGRFVITLDPKDGQQTYQGIVALEGNSIADILQNYMIRSEQLDTRLWLMAGGQGAAGMLLQKMPEQKSPDVDAWERVCQLAETVQSGELESLTGEQLIHRLFHEEDVRLFAERPVHFHCSCSRENVARMLKMLGREEVQQILAEREEVEVFCEFCNQRYLFDAIDAETVFINDSVYAANETQH